MIFQSGVTFIVDPTVISGSLDSLSLQLDGSMFESKDPKDITLFSVPLLDESILLFVSFTSFHRL